MRSMLAADIWSPTPAAPRNWLGTERMRTNEHGAVQQYCDWTMFGEFISCAAYPYTAATGLSTRNFAGYEHDAETGLEHTQFRYYNAHIGRWMSADPYMGSMDIGNPQSMNRYAYVGNRPINLFDLSLAKIKNVRSFSDFGLFERLGILSLFALKALLREHSAKKQS